tara:strand:- start:283 stop:2241 length:1959 start_codon:yes stop_codon:yes gene_type:complete
MKKQKRKYTKRNKEYWEGVSSRGSEYISNNSGNSPIAPPFVDGGWETHVDGIEWQADAYSRRSVVTNSNRTQLRDNRIATYEPSTKFDQIAEMSRPFAADNNGIITISEAISLCQKAYDNVAIVRNTVEAMVEFAVAELYLEGGSEPARKFYYQWFKEIRQDKLADQFFREFYRSSNIFFTRIEGEISAETVRKLRRSSLTKAKIPVRYILLNPEDVARTPGTIYDDATLIKILSSYEIQRLKNPQTDSDKRIFNGLPEATQIAIKNYGSGYRGAGVYMDLPSDQIISCFGFKQDYEPFAVPYVFPVLDDIDQKYLYKKIEKQVARTVDQVVLLVTHGAEPDKGGVNSLVLRNLQDIFRNRSVGRTVVADYTTDAKFVIPELDKVIGPEKYRIVQEDIKDGLQNLLIGNDKFGNLQTKAQLFLERIKTVRAKYIYDFLYPEMERVGRELGFRSIPTPKFVEMSLQDKAAVQRVVTRLIELGILHPEDGLTAIQKNVFPTADQLLESQERYLEERKKGLYNPLVGGVPVMEGMESKTPTKVPKEPRGRPAEASSLEGMRVFYKNVEDLDAYIKKCLKKTFKKRVLTQEHRDIATSLSQDIIVSSEMSEWIDTCKSCLEDFEKVKELHPNGEILRIAGEFQLNDLAAATLYHSR